MCVVRHWDEMRNENVIQSHPIFAIERSLPFQKLLTNKSTTHIPIELTLLELNFRGKLPNHDTTKSIPVIEKKSQMNGESERTKVGKIQIMRLKQMQKWMEDAKFCLNSPTFLSLYLYLFIFIFIAFGNMRTFSLYVHTFLPPLPLYSSCTTHHRTTFVFHSAQSLLYRSIRFGILANSSIVKL